MEFMEWRKRAYRREMLIRNFFEDVNIENDELKKDILDWMFYLKNNRKISINSFRELFSKFGLITFPIQVSGEKHKLQIKDKYKKEFYLCYDPYNYGETRIYAIGKRTKKIDKVYEYKITKVGIVQTTLNIMQLNQDGTNTDNVIIFEGHKDTTNIELKTDKSTIKIFCPLQNYMDTNKISNYLLKVANEKEYDDNVRSIFEWFFNMFMFVEEPYVLTVESLCCGETLSKIFSENNIVKEYWYTQRKSESEISLEKTCPNETCLKFVSKQSKY